ncbi:MAG: hypothetical protein J6A94_07735 [Lachnospiraceae bacterium]|nr:hypothetical protein [Lachnospiraceae bacterium]
MIAEALIFKVFRYFIAFEKVGTFWGQLVFCFGMLLSRLGFREKRDLEWVLEG